MKLIAPDYFKDFACLMGDCRHSCCVGWEIDIDEDSLARYRNVPGEMGRRLQESISEEGESACFRLTEGERCPFLNQDGLCEMIIRLGESSLCQICADHPRFRSFFSDREEIGLGLCCEAAGRLILMRKDPVRLITLGDDGEGELPDHREISLYVLREELFALMQDRSLPVERRVRRMLSRAGLYMTDIPHAHWAKFFMGLERLDDAWGARLQELLDAPECSAACLNAEEWEIAFEQLMIYLLYRHMPAILEDGEETPRISYAALIWHMIRKLCAVHATMHGSVSVDDLIELSRLYSSEIEYSDENVAAILSELFEMSM